MTKSMPINEEDLAQAERELTHMIDVYDDELNNTPNWIYVARHVVRKARGGSE